MQAICSMSNNPQGLEWMERFLQHHSIVSMDGDSDEELSHIYSGFLYAQLAEKSALTSETCSEVVNATLQFWHEVERCLKPSLGRLQYYFTANHLSQVIRISRLPYNS